MTVAEPPSGALPNPHELDSAAGDDLRKSLQRIYLLDRIPLGEFRRKVTTIADPVERYQVKYCYEMGARANEACSIPLKSDLTAIRKLKDGKEVMGNSVALGPRKRDVEFDTYEGCELMRITFGTLKRKNRDSRVVALPLGCVDPWVDELAAMFNKLAPDDALMPFNRRTLNRTLYKNGLVIAKRDGSMKNPLRHIRINHLISYYLFTPFQVTAYVGWEPSTNLAAVGGAPTLSQYSSTMWPDYFPKLLKPLPP